MGQRLNIEIWNDGKVLANAYYHWEAYTKSSANIVQHLLQNIEGNKEFDNELLYAVRLLETTGAKLTNEEKIYARKLPELKEETFDDATSRDDGLIAITNDGIQNTRFWEEGYVRIHLDVELVDFNVFFKETTWEWAKNKKEYDEIENPNYKDLPLIDVLFSHIKFNNFNEIVSNYFNNEYEEFITKIDPITVFSIIE